MIGFAEGPLGTAGKKCAAAWRDADGFHIFYAMGYESYYDAENAARIGAIELGYQEPPRWAFWKHRITVQRHK